MHAVLSRISRGPHHSPRRPELKSALLLPPSSCSQLPSPSEAPSSLLSVSATAFTQSSRHPVLGPWQQLHWPLSLSNTKLQSDLNISDKLLSSTLNPILLGHLILRQMTTVSDISSQPGVPRLTCTCPEDSAQTSCLLRIFNFYYSRVVSSL